jgi:hypothetical protein
VLDVAFHCENDIQRQSIVPVLDIARVRPKRDGSVVADVAPIAIGYGIAFMSGPRGDEEGFATATPVRKRAVRDDAATRQDHSPLGQLDGATHDTRYEHRRRPRAKRFAERNRPGAGIEDGNGVTGAEQV